MILKRKTISLQEEEH